MKKYLFIFFILFTPLSHAGEFEFSLGIGAQYSGIGTQFAYKNLKTKYFVSAGIPAYSLGMQRVISDNNKHSAGFSLGQYKGLFTDKDSKYGLITYNYHFTNFQESGWVLGTGIGYVKENSFKALFSDVEKQSESSAFITLDIGYKF